MEELDLAFCSTCNKLYDNDIRKPLILLCGHSYCQECINKDLQEKKQISCIFDQNVIQGSQISQIFINQMLLQLAINKKKKTSVVVCDNHKDERIEFFCQKDKELYCRNCNFKRHIDHMNQVFEIPDIKNEANQLKNILEQQIIQKAMQLLKTIDSVLIPDGGEILVGSIFLQASEDVFKFIQEISKLEPETDYLKHLNLISKIGHEQYLQQVNEIEELKNQQLKINQELQTNFEEFKQEIQIFKQEKSIQKETNQKVNQNEQNIKNLEQIQEILQNKIIGKEVDIKFNPNKKHQNIQLSENNKVAKGANNQ